MTVPLSWTFTVASAGRGTPRPGAPAAAPVAPPATPPAATEPPAAAPAVKAPDVATVAAPATDVNQVQLFDQFEILGTTGGYIGSDAFLKFISDAERGVKSTGMFEGKGPLAILALVFIGGLALNLTPCVLPMIPVNLAIIGATSAGAQRARRGRGFLLGAVYGGAMALVYGVLGLIVILTAGTFGTINASPWFNLGIAALFVVLGLAMFDVIMVDFTRFRSGMRLGESGRGTLWLAFSMGAIAALLAGACVAPVVIQVDRLCQQPARVGHVNCARAALRSRPRHGPALADRWRRPGVAPEAGHVDGARQAGDGRPDSHDRGLLRLHRLRHLREPLGGSERACRRACRRSSRKAGTRRSPKAFSQRSSRTRRRSSTSGRRGARTASSWTRRR